MLSKKRFKIPAKALLFGEYGVLHGYPAVGITFYNDYFIIEVEINKSLQKETNVSVTSSFFLNQELHFILGDLKNKDEFFYKLLMPWKDLLFYNDLNIKILHSYSPNLGFGSSSAIIAGVSLALFESIFQKKGTLEEEKLWIFIRQSIVQCQGKGSGYDVGIQLASLIDSQQTLSVWSYQNSLNSVVPVIKKIEVAAEGLKNYGCFLKTNIYSDTKKFIQQHIIEFAYAHGALSEEFLKDISIDNIKILMDKSNIISLKQELFPTDLYFVNMLNKLKDISFKSMGAGHGDCLWVLCSENKLLELGFTESDIGFAFNKDHC